VRINKATVAIVTRLTHSPRIPGQETKCSTHVQKIWLNLDMWLVFTCATLAWYLPSSSVRPPVCVSQVGVLLRGSCKQRYTIAQGLLVFWCHRSRRNSNGVIPCRGTK